MSADIILDATYREGFGPEGPEKPPAVEKTERKRSKFGAQILDHKKRASVLVNSPPEQDKLDADGELRLPNIKGPKSNPEKGEKRESIYASGAVLGDALKKKLIKVQQQLEQERRARLADEARFQAQIRRLQTQGEALHQEKEELDDLAASKARHAKKMRARLASVVEGAKGSIQAAKKKASEFKAKYTEVSGTAQEQLEQLQVSYERVARSNAVYKRRYAKICQALGEDLRDDDDDCDDVPPAQPAAAGEGGGGRAAMPCSPPPAVGIVGRVHALQEERAAAAQRLRVAEQACRDALQGREGAEAELRAVRAEKDEAEGMRDRYLAQVKEVYAAMGEEHRDQSEESAPPPPPAPGPPAKPPKGRGAPGPRRPSKAAPRPGERPPPAPAAPGKGEGGRAGTAGSRGAGGEGPGTASVAQRLAELRDELARLRAEAPVLRADLADWQGTCTDAQAQLAELRGQHETVTAALQQRDQQHARAADQAALLGLQVAALAERLNTLGETAGVPGDLADAVLGHVEEGFRAEQGRGAMARTRQAGAQGTMQQLSKGTTAGECAWAGVLQKVEQDKDSAVKARLAAEAAQRQVGLLEGELAAAQAALASAAVSSGHTSGSLAEQVAVLVGQRARAQHEAAEAQRERGDLQQQLRDLGQALEGGAGGARPSSSPLAARVAQALQDRAASERHLAAARRQLAALEGQAAEHAKLQEGLARALQEAIGAAGGPIPPLGPRQLLGQVQLLARAASSAEASSRAELASAQAAAERWRARAEELEAQLSETAASLTEQGRVLDEHSLKEVMLQEQIRQMLHENKRLGGFGDDPRARARVAEAAQRVRDICTRYVSAEDEQRAIQACGRRHSLALTVPRQVNPLAQMATFEVDLLVNNQLTSSFQVEPGNTGIFQAAIHYFHISPTEGNTSFDTTLPPGSQSSNMLVDLIMVPGEGQAPYIAKKGDILGLCIRVCGRTFREESGTIEQLPARELVYNNNVMRASEVVGAVPDEQRSRMTHISIWPDLTSSWRWTNTADGWRLQRIRWRFLLKKCFPEIADAIQTLVTCGQEA